MPMFYRSRHNLARWFTLSMGSILVIFASAIYYQKAADQLEALDRLLYKKSSIIVAGVRYKRDRDRWQVNLENVPLLGKQSQSLSSEIVYARWYNVRGQLVQFYGLPRAEKLTANSAFLTLKTNSANLEEEWLRQITLPVQYQGKTIAYLQIATPMTSIRESLAEFLLLLALTVPATIGVIGLVGGVLGGLAMQPIRQAYELLQRFTADASHELRSPIAAILSQAQVGLLTSGNTDPKERDPRSALVENRFQKIATLAKSMSSLVSNLLFLSRHAGRLTRQSLKEIDLQSYLKEIVEDCTVLSSRCNDEEAFSQALQVLMERKKYSFKYPPPQEMSPDEVEALFQAKLNQSK
jgi:two-component system, OmpR family, manganese sensing sensor histidine kinase